MVHKKVESKNVPVLFLTIGTHKNCKIVLVVYKYTIVISSHLY